MSPVFRCPAAPQGRHQQTALPPPPDVSISSSSSSWCPHGPETPRLCLGQRCPQVGWTAREALAPWLQGRWEAEAPWGCPAGLPQGQGSGFSLDPSLGPQGRVPRKQAQCVCPTSWSLQGWCLWPRGNIWGAARSQAIAHPGSFVG